MFLYKINTNCYENPCLRMNFKNAEAELYSEKKIVLTERIQFICIWKVRKVKLPYNKKEKTNK